MTNRWRGAVPSWTAALLTALAVGCSKDAPKAASGILTGATAVANGASFLSPFDAAPSPDGNTVYFTGVDPVAGAALFKVPAAGGTPSVLASGCATAACDASIGAPLGIAVSSDGSKVFAADPAYVGGSSDTGYIFSVPTGGGAQTLLAETGGYNARFVTVSKVGGSDNLYFIGDDKTDGAAGIFKDVGGTVTAVIKGGDPQAATVAGNGTVYFIDKDGSVQKVAGGGSTASALGGAAANFLVSYPVGMALSGDERFLLVPVVDPATSTQSIARIDVNTGASTLMALGLPATNTEGGGFHKAANADVFSFVDSGAGSTGTVYVLK